MRKCGKKGILCTVCGESEAVKDSQPPRCAKCAEQREKKAAIGAKSNKTLAELEAE